MIPEDKKVAVIHALEVTFGVSEFEDISELTAGLTSALVFRIVVLNKSYLLRIITRTDAMSDPTQQYACMSAAAEAGIAPRIRYTDIENRISITDFIEVKPFSSDLAKSKLPELLSKLHSLKAFPFRINYLDMISGFIQKFQVLKPLPDQMTSKLFGLFDKIKSTYAPNSRDLVACHNDLKPENILFDGESAWLVDWEAAFLNDRYADLAMVANFVIRNDADESDYLKAYFREEANEYQQARFFLMRQIVHFSYFVVFTLMGKTPGKPIDPCMAKPGFKEFHELIWAGKISMADMDARIQYALVHMEQLEHNLQLKRFDESLAIVSNYPIL